MVEKDFRIIQKRFRDIVGPIASAGISEEGARRSTGIIIELVHKINTKTTQPTDLLRATLAASQLIRRWGQLRERVIEGTLQSVNDEETLRLIQKKYSIEHASKEEMVRLMTIVYVASPAEGANKAMEVLSELQTIYPDISLRQPIS